MSPRQPHRQHRNVHSHSRVFACVTAPALPCCIALMLLACETEDFDLEDTVENRNTEIIENLNQVGFDDDDISVRELPIQDQNDRLVHQETEPSIVVQGDIVVSLDASRAMSGNHEGQQFRLWRYGTVDPDQLICFVPIRSLGSGAESWNWTLIGDDAYTALNWAGGNYNAASISLSFAMRSGTISSEGVVSANLSNCDDTILVYSSTLASGVLGNATFPPGDGGPGSPLRLSPDIEGIWSADRREHVVTHEIGHSLGIIHSDWRTGDSCAVPDPQTQAGSQIPGTVDQTEDSVMTTCTPLFTDGELEAHDHAALEALWPE